MVLWIENKRYISIILTLVLAIEIFLVSSIPGSKTTDIHSPLIPIIYHFSVYFLLNFFLFFSIKGKKEMSSTYIITALILSLVYAISDEFHQSFVPMRSPDLNDILTDSIGLSISVLLAAFISKKSNQQF